MQRPHDRHRTRLTPLGMAVVLAALFVAVVAAAVGAAAALESDSDPSASASDSTSTAEPSASTEPPTTSPEPTPEAALTMPRSEPERVQIPSIDLDSELMDLGLQSDGTLEVPPEAFPAGWYTGAPTPGELGPAVIAGHVTWNGPGVFYDLADVEPGAMVRVDRKNGSEAVFEVTRVEHFEKRYFPSEVVYGDIDHAGLRLITCGGLNDATGEYEDNTVVFADLVATVKANA